MRRPSTRLANWLLAGASLALSLMAAELVLRVAPLPIAERVRKRQQAQAGTREVQPRGLYRLHPEIGWTLTPGFSGRFRGEDFDVSIEANTQGIRDRTFGARKPGVFRILGLGDSFAFGWGVENDESLYKVLERRLGRGRERRYEVINAAIPGFGTWEALRLLEAIGLANDPDLIVLAFYEGNDYRNNGDAPRKRTIENGLLRDAPSRGRWLLSRSVMAGLVDAAVSGLAQKRRFRSDVEKTVELLRQMKALADAKGVPLVLLSIPDQDPEFYRRPAALRTYDRLASGLTPGEARERLRAACRAEGIHYLRLSDRFEAVASASDYRLEDTHLNRRGHEAVAEELLAGLRTLGLLPPSDDRGNRAPFGAAPPPTQRADPATSSS